MSKKTHSKSKPTAKKTKTSKKKASTSKSVDKMCRFCTQCANKPIYHDGPYGGGKNCKYGKNGKPKKTRGLNSVQQNESKDDSEEPAPGNDDDEDEDAFSGDGDSDSECGAIDEYDYLPHFGGGFGNEI